MAYPSQNEANPFVKSLTEGLVSVGCPIEIGLDQFWNHYEDYDLIHFNWPNSIFKDWQPTERGVELLKKILADAKSKNIKIVYTRHNEKPHYENNPLISLCYELIENHANAIVHLGDFKFEELKLQYPHAEHYVIPHHLSFKIQKEISKQEARKKLGIPDNKLVILCFGAFRNRDEAKLVLDSFEALEIKDKFLLVPHLAKWFGLKTSAFPLSPAWFKNKKLKSALHAENKLVYDKTIPDSLLPSFFYASDLVLIQRTNILNSGNLPLAFHFRKMVIGPNTGNVGEILKKSDNLTFDIKDIPNSLIEKIKESSGLDPKAIGQSNYDYAIRHWDPDTIALEYQKIYVSLIS